MKRNSRSRSAVPQRWTRLAALSGLLLLGLAPAERSISIYGGSFTGTEAIEVEVNAPLRTSFTLRRVFDPAAMFAVTRDPHSPQLSPGAHTQLVRTLRLGRKDGTLTLGRLPSGVYLLGTGGLNAVVLVSKLGLVVKRDQTDAQTFTADRQSGQTRAARVWALSGKEGAQPTGSPAPRLASSDGIARFQKAEYGEKVTFLARFGDDWAISGSEWNSYAAPLVRGYVYTDRPVYRPGQHVDFKAVLRRAGNLKPLANATVRVKVTSPNDDEVFRKTLTTNALGSLGAGLDLPAGARLGEYSFSLTPESAAESGQSDINGSFQVEAYQKPEYAVTVTPERGRAVQGEKVSVKISARYLFGGTLSGARVNYNVTRAPYYSPGFDTESLAPDSSDGSDYGSDLVIQDETRLDKNGDLNLSLPLAKDADGNPISYRIEAEVEDESRRTVSARSQVIAFPASLNVESSTDGYVYDVNKPITVSLDTRDLKAVGRAAPVSLELIREDYTYNKTSRKWIYSEATLARSSARTGPDGLSSAVLRAPRSGGYRLRATVRDSQGRRSTNENFVWVIKKGESLSWNYRDMTLKLDRKSYAPSDTATLLIGNPAPGSAVLVTLEGDRLRKSVVLRSQGAAITYSFPVTADMAPNISVTATSLGGGQLYSGEATVKVPRRDGQLAVKVTPQKVRYAPGDTGKLSVDVQAAGKGVPAELALGVVDGAIYLVRRDDSTPISQVFDAPRENVVGTSTSLNFYFSQAGNVAQAPKPALSEPAFAQAKEGRADAAASADTFTPRQDFRDTILWLPNLLTDAQGHAEVEFKFPDNLTTWVATARAQGADVSGPARFGQNTASTMTTKDVIARLSLPPFLVRGDVATLSGIVNNTLIVPVAGRANASLSGLNPLGGAALTPTGTALQIAAEGRARSDMRVQAAQVGQASVTFTARTASGNDALKLPLPVKARGIQVTQTAVGSATGPGVKLNIPADTNLSTLNLNLSLTPSLLSAVTPALEYLVGYPYGCTEQTMSRFLPALLARQTLGSAQLPISVTKNLTDITSAGLARLQLFQHEDGGWNFWQWDESTLEMSAYVTQGLLRAKALGAKVDNRMLDSALKYLTRNAASSKARQADRASAYRALAVAGQVDTEQLLAFSHRGDLEPYALASTALALSQVKQPGLARDLLDRLKARRMGSSSGQIHWEKPKNARNPDWYDYWDDNSIQVTATALEALAKLDPGSPLIAPTSQWLLGARRGPQWISTQDTTSVIIAALALKPGPVVSGGVIALLDGKSAGTASLDGRGAVSLKVDTAGLKAGSHTLSLQGNNLPQSLSYSSALTFSREQAQLKGDQSKGLLLSRRYERLDPLWNDKEKRYTYRRTPLQQLGKMQPVTTGDLILVTLSVQPQKHSARYLLISDPIPAGMKALDERSLAIAGLKDPNEYDWESWNYWYAGRDLLDDRVDLYADYLSGRQSITYLLRAQTPGSFTALPTHAFLMYDPEVEAYGPAATLTVRDRGQ